MLIIRLSIKSPILDKDSFLSFMPEGVLTIKYQDHKGKIVNLTYPNTLAKYTIKVGYLLVEWKNAYYVLDHLVSGYYCLKTVK